MHSSHLDTRTPLAWRILASFLWAALSLAGCGGSGSGGSGSAAAITQNPTNLTVAAGATATFTAAASGTPAPTVQWQQSADSGSTFTNIAGATANSLSFTAAPGENGYRYRAVFVNSLGSATTSAATLTVTSSAVAITKNPSNLTVAAGATATFTAAASGNPAPTVQWQQSADSGSTFTNIPGATASSLSFTAAPAESGYLYRAVFINSASSATTSAATLTVTSSAVAITKNPANLTVAAGATATFTAAASGNPAPTVQWQQSTDSGSTFTNIPGATASSLSFTAAPAESGYLYRAVFINGVSSATTSAATLTVTSSTVTITKNPANLTVASGALATFTAAASGNPAPTVQWQLSTDSGSTFSNIAGATATSLSFTAASGQNGYLYRAVFVNSAGSATTSAAKLTVSSGKHWRTPLAIESNTGTAVFPVEVADANGNVLALWPQVSGQYTTIWVNRYDAASAAWGTAQRISSATDSANESESQFSLAIDSAGNALAVWTQTAGAFNATNVTGIWSSRFSASSLSWSAPQLIGGDSTPASVVGLAQLPDYPQVAIDANGNAFAVWEQNDGHSSAVQNVWAARYTAGVGWGAAQPITTDNNVSAGYRRIGFDSAGNATLMYTINTVVSGVGDVRIKALRYSAGTGSWGGSQFIAADTTYSVQEPQLAVAADGNAVAVWNQSDGTSTNVVANRYDIGTGTWGSAQIIDTNLVGDSARPGVAMDAVGNAWSVWGRTTSSQGTRVWGNRLTAGGSWGTPQIIDTNNASVGVTPHPQLAFDAQGNVMAVWAQKPPSATYVQVVAEYFTAGSWGPGQVLETVGGDSGDPQIVFDASGNATAVWDKSDVYPGVNVTIWADRYE